MRRCPGRLLYLIDVSGRGVLSFQYTPPQVALKPASTLNPVTVPGVRYGELYAYGSWMPVINVFGTGVLFVPKEPPTIAPHWLLPQADRAPSACKDWKIVFPALTAITPELAPRPDTGTGVVLRVVVVSPSCPELLSPQAHTEPSFFNSKELLFAAATALAPDPGAITWTGEVVLLPEPSPSWP